MIGSVNPKKDQDDILKRKYQSAYNTYGAGGEALSRGLDKARGALSSGANLTKNALGKATYSMPPEPANAPYSFESGSNVNKTADKIAGFAGAALRAIPNRGTTPGLSVSEATSPSIVPDPARATINAADPARATVNDVDPAKALDNPLDMGRTSGPAFAPFVTQPVVPEAPETQEEAPLSGQALTSKLNDNMSKMDAIVASGGASPEQLAKIKSIKSRMAQRTLGSSAGQGLTNSQRLGGLYPNTQVRTSSGNLQFEGSAGDAAKFTSQPGVRPTKAQLAQHDFNQGLKSGRTRLATPDRIEGDMSAKARGALMIKARQDETARRGQDLIRRGQDLDQQLGLAGNATTQRGQDNTYQLGGDRNDIARGKADSYNDVARSTIESQNQALTRSQNLAGAEEALRQAYASGDPEAIARALQQRSTYTDNAKIKAPDSMTEFQKQKLALDSRKAEDKFVTDNQMSGLSREELIRQYRMQSDPVSQYLP